MKNNTPPNVLPAAVFSDCNEILIIMNLYKNAMQRKRIFLLHFRDNAITNYIIKSFSYLTFILISLWYLKFWGRCLYLAVEI